MEGDRVWVDFWFVQATAWYIGLDLWIVDCQSKDNKPFIEISGNLEDPEVPCSGPIMTLGTKSNVHYQSLLPTEMLHLEFRRIVTEISNISVNGSQSTPRQPIQADDHNISSSSKEFTAEHKGKVDTKTVKSKNKITNNETDNTPPVVNKQRFVMESSLEKTHLVPNQ